MALKDCKFFVNVNGKKTEMDYDQFRAYLLEDVNLNAVAPDLTRKKGAKAGYEVTASAPTVTARAEAAPVRAEAAPARAEAAPATTTVETVTAEPSEAKRIADSVGKQKVDAQGFTPAQREYLVDKVKEVYKEVQKDSAPDKFVIKVPGDGQFTVKTSVEVNSLHRRLTGNDVPGVTPQDKGASDMERVKKGITFGNKDVNAIRPFSATSKPAASEMFKEDEGNALYPLERHGTAAAIENKSTDKEYVTDGSLLIPSSAIEQGKTKLIKAAPVKTEGVSTAKVQFVWQKATKEATVPAEIAGVWQSSTAKGLALIEVSGRFIALDPNKLNLAIQLTGADGVLIPKNADSDSLVVLTRQGQPVAVIAPFRLKPENVEATFEGAQDAINEMKGEGASPTSLSANLKKPASKVKAEAAPAPAKLSPATPRPITVESLRETMNLTKAQAEAVLAVYEAMGLPLPTMRVAKGVFDKPELQEQYEKSMAEEGMLARGYIEFFDPDEAAKLDGVLAVIRGFGAANFSTPVHEGAHFYRRFMLNEENGFTAQEIKTAEDWAGAKNGKWTVAAEEKWARGFERYLRSGQAPIPALNKLFEKIARWMRKVYETVTGSAIDVEVSPEVKRVFDKIFEIQAARQKGATGTIAGGKRDVLSQEEPTVGPVWRSNIASALKTWNQDKGTPQQLMAHLGKVKGAQEEAKWIGLNEFLEGKKSVTKAEVADFVDSNPYVVDEVTLDEKSAPSIHLGYRLLGGENYREIILTSPKIQQFTAHHYTNTTQSYLAHMRLSTFRTAQNQKTILVDEVQSDLHQKGRKQGYQTQEDAERQARRDKRAEESYILAMQSTREASDLARELAITLDRPGISDVALMTEARSLAKERPPLVLPAGQRERQMSKIAEKAATGQKVRGRQREIVGEIRKAGLMKDFRRVIELVRRYDTESDIYTQWVYEKERTGPVIPMAPFRESADWSVMLFKRAVRLAAEEGADFVAWTPGEMQSARYQRQAGDLKQFYDVVLPKALQKFAKQWGGKIEQVDLNVVEINEMESRLNSMREQLQLAEYEGDSDIVAEVEAEIAALEAEIADSRTESPVKRQTRTFPAIRITPQMKAEAMKGFTLFQAEQGPGKVSAEAVKQKQAERARILKQEEPTEPASRINEYIAQIDAFKKEISQKTGEPFSLLTLAPRDLDAYERLIDQAERVASYEAQQADIKAREADIKPRRALVDKAAMDWAGVSEVTPAAPPSKILGTPSDRFKTGQPVLVKVYHGTGPEGIQGGVFSFRFGGENTGAESARQGYFFAGTEETAGVYTMSFTSEDEDEEQGDVYEFYVRLDNPFVFNMGGGDYSEETYFYVMQQARADGHDGAIIINTYDGGPLDNIFTVLHGYENQIKSADLETYGPDGKPVPLSERFNPKTTSIYFQDDKPVTAPVDSAFVQRKMKERAERLRQAKAGQAATGEAKPKAEAKATPPPPPQAAKTARPSGTTRPSAPRQGKSKTDEQRLKDAKERAANPPAEPSEETMVNRKVQAFINTFAKSLFAGSIPLTMTDAAGNQVDTESVFLDMLKQYRAAFAAADQGRVDAVSAKLREITRPPRAPKDLKQLMEEAKKRAGQPKTAKTAAQKREQDIGKEVQKAINNFARLRSTGKISEMVDLGDGVTVSREDLLLQALADLQAAYRTSNTYLGAPEIAKAQRRIMDILFVPPRVPKKPQTTENILSAHAWGTASVRSPLSYLNMVGSYEAIAGELGARVSNIFQFTRTRMAHGYYPTWGAAIADLQKSLKGVKEELRQAGYPGMLPVIDAHVDRIRKSAEGVGPLTPENVKKAWDNGNIGGLASNAAKAFVFNTSLRFSPKAVLMNYMQPLFTLFPHVTPKEFYNFWVESGKPETVARVRDLALKESGGRIEGMGAGDRFFNPFTNASERARIMGHLAGEMMADRLNLKGLARDVYVRGWTEKVEFDNSAWNVPPAFSGNLNSVLFQFKPYVAKNVERFVADWKRGVEGSSSGTLARRAKLIGVQLGVGGIGSLLTIIPGVKGITGILILGYLAQGFSTATGDDEFGEKIAEAVYYGAPAWIGLDLASSTGFLEEPFGNDAFQKALNLVAGPAIYKSAAAINGLQKYYEDAQKVAPLGKEKEREEVLARRRRTILNSITPLSRMAETAWSLAQGKRPDMFLEEPTPLQNKEVLLRLFGGSPIRQTKFYDYKESFDWQKSLLNRPIDIPGIKRLKKETDATYKERVKRIEGWREQYRNELANHPRFSRLSPEDQEKAFELLQRNITEQANQVRPNEGNLRAARILRTLISGRPERARREKRKLYVEPED